MIWGVAGLRPNFFYSGRIFLAELAQESWRDLAAVVLLAAGGRVGGWAARGGGTNISAGDTVTQEARASDEISAAVAAVPAAIVEAAAGLFFSPREGLSDDHWMPSSNPNPSLISDHYTPLQL